MIRDTGYVTRRTFHRFWMLVAVAYAIGAIGLVIALAVLDNQRDTLADGQDRLEAQSSSLAAAAGAYCVAGLADDAGEDRVIRELAAGEPLDLPAVCREIIARIRAAAD